MSIRKEEISARKMGFLARSGVAFPQLGALAQYGIVG
jgi:hypothetical protein